MTNQRDLERTLDAFFAVGADEVADRVIDDALLTIDHTPQRRPSRVPRRLFDMSSSLKLATIAAAIVLAVGGATWMLGRSPGPAAGEAPLPTASASASAASPRSVTPSSSPSISTASWVKFSSDRYGFTIAHPPSWTEEAADHDWTFENDVQAWQSSGVDSFRNAEGSVRVSAWSAKVDPGSTLESLIEAYCIGQNEGPCPDVLNGTVAVETADGHGGLYVSRGDPMAFFLDGQTMYVVAVWREENAPEVRQYGGARRLVEAFVSTLTLPTAADTRDWVTYKSDRYGFSIGHPPGWSETPATRAWTAADGNDWRSRSPGMDAFTNGRIRVSAWAVPLEASFPTDPTWADVATWIEGYCVKINKEPCSSGLLDTAVRLCVEWRDCHPSGLLVSGESEVQAFFTSGIYPGVMVIVSVWSGSTEATAPFGGIRGLLAGILGTMNVWEESMDRSGRPPITAP